MTRASLLALGLLASGLSGRALADDYPVGGKWTYEDARANGPAKSCTGRIMEFRGPQRFDTGGSVPQYRNVRVSSASPTVFSIVDEFFTVQIRGRVAYALRLIDADHIELRLQQGGSIIPLRRCI